MTFYFRYKYTDGTIRYNRDFYFRKSHPSMIIHFRYRYAISREYTKALIVKYKL